MAENVASAWNEAATGKAILILAVNASHYGCNLAVVPQPS